jgi:fucose permease
VLALLLGYRLTIAIGLLTYVAAAGLFAAARRKDSAGR